MFLISNLEYVWLGLSSYFIVGFLTPIMRKVALRTNFFDTPNSPHKSHVVPVPYLGGVAIIIGVLVVTYTAPLIRGNSQLVGPVSTLLIPSVFLGIVGFIDDRISLAPFPRFLAQSLAGIFTAGWAIYSDSLGNPTGNSYLDVLITVVWIVGITNSINFLDNVDGGATGIVATISLGIFGISLLNYQYYIAAMSIVLAGAMFGFLLWNKLPARIYMGDAGALFLGVIVAILTVRLDPVVTSKTMSLSIPLVLMAVPIMDSTVAILSRLRRKLSPFHGGRDHLSHRLIRVGFSKRVAVYILWGASGFCAAVSLIFSRMDASKQYLVTIFALAWVTLVAYFLSTPDTDD